MSGKASNPFPNSTLCWKLCSAKSQNPNSNGCFWQKIPRFILQWPTENLSKHRDRNNKRTNSEQVQIDTINQAKRKNFIKHRAGRIGASQSKAAASTDPSLPSQSLIQSICYPELSKITTKKAVLHGCQHEAGAINSYEQFMKTKHVSFKVLKCGTFINEDHPWVHATPDLLCTGCCGEGCGEIKCPFCIENLDFDA